jgi:branched-chain amino acid transport system permease protein
MGELVQVIYSGLVLGAIYSVMAMGLTLIWGGIRVLNMAHGALFTVGGYAALSITVNADLPVALGLLGAIVASGVLGAIIYGCVFQPLMRRPDWENTTLAAGLGAAILIEAAIILIYGSREKPLPSIVGGEFELPGGVIATGQGILMMIVGAAVLLSLSLFLTRTRYGIAIRALASNRRGAQIVGINVGLLLLGVFVLGSALSGLAGVLYSSFYFLSPVGGFTAPLKGLIVTIVGGLGNLRGTVLAAYVVGLIESAVSVWLGTRWSLPLLFVTIAILLVVRPSGLLSPRHVVAVTR